MTPAQRGRSADSLFNSYSYYFGKGKPNHIGVARDGKGYVITAEYRDGYEILARFETAAEAQAALPELLQGIKP